MKLILQIITVGVMLSGCIITLALTWAYFRAERRARRQEAQRATDWLISTGLRPPS
jgi:squalene cyclase